MQFIWVMDTYVDTNGVPTGWAVMSASEADRLISSSRLISEIENEDPNIADGPLSVEQHWLITGRHRAPNEDLPVPKPSNFVRPGVIQSADPASQAFRTSGLYTCSPASQSGNGMWEIYLDMFPSGAPVRPWAVWALEVPDCPVAEITSATDWTRFVDRYGYSVRDMLHPEWDRAAADFAAVHLTARAVAAAQGFSFETSRGLTAPVFWDVEQTLWLRWSFGSTRLLRRYE